MIGKATKEIAVEDVLDFLKRRVQEDKRLDYKASLALTTNAEKHEFVADATAMANSEGGDLFFGRR